MDAVIGPGRKRVVDRLQRAGKQKEPVDASTRRLRRACALIRLGFSRRLRMFAIGIDVFGGIKGRRVEEVRPVKSRYLVVYDYTTGGVWAFIDATSESEIVVRYPELKIIRTRPGWMMAEEENGLPIYDLEDPPTGLLRNLLDSRATSSR